MQRELAIIAEAAATLRALDIPRPLSEPLQTPLARTATGGAVSRARRASREGALAVASARLLSTPSRSPPTLAGLRAASGGSARRRLGSGGLRSAALGMAEARRTHVALTVAAAAGAVLALGLSGMLQPDMLGF